MQKPVYSPEEETELMAALWSPKIKNDPEAFVLFAFPWGQENTPLHKHKGPRAWQREILRDIKNHIAFTGSVNVFELLRMATASGRGIGKSALVSWLILWMLTTRIGSSVIVSANSESQLRGITWGELAKWSTMVINAHWWEISATRLAPAAWLAQLVERDLKKGTRYWGAEGRLWSEENPDSYAGPHNHDGMMVIFDEASGIPDAIWSVANGYFTEPVPDRFWFAFSNPRRNSGYFFECFGAKREFWNTRQIDARSVEGTDPGEYSRIIQEYGEDSYQARVEVYGRFPASDEDQFIPTNLIDDAAKRSRYKDPTAPVIVGVDPARGGNDWTVIAVRQGRDIIALKRYKDHDTMAVVGLVIDAIREYQPSLTVIDEGGLGYGILDRLTEQRYKVKGVNFGWKSSRPAMYKNKRAEMWGDMKDWMKTASIPNDKQLKTALGSPMMKLDSSGAMQLEGKKEMKARGLASPDEADAIAVTFAYRVANRDYTSSAQRQTRTFDRGALSANWLGN